MNQSNKVVLTVLHRGMRSFTDEAGNVIEKSIVTGHQEWQMQIPALLQKPSYTSANRCGINIVKGKPQGKKVNLMIANALDLCSSVGVNSTLHPKDVLVEENQIATTLVCEDFKIQIFK